MVEIWQCHQMTKLYKKLPVKTLVSHWSSQMEVAVEVAVVAVQVVDGYVSQT